MGSEFIVTVCPTPSHSTLYWVDGGGNDGEGEPRIERCHLDGSNRTTVVSGDLGRPRGIAVDNPVGVEEGEGRIYWTDNLNGKIESASLNNDSDRRVEIGEHCWAWLVLYSDLCTLDPAPCLTFRYYTLTLGPFYALWSLYFGPCTLTFAL